MLQKWPSDVCLRFGLANIFFNCGNLSQAKQEYHRIIDSQDQNDSLAFVFRQLVLVAFYENNHKEVEALLSKFKVEKDDIVMKLVSAFIEPKVEDKITKIEVIIEQKVPNFVRPYLFKGYLLFKEKK